MWLALLLRWAHFIVGIAWIGASFYFNWLENHLQRQHQPEDTAGDLWAVHGGGFYYLKKLAVAPGELPPVLHWFKWEAYTTWLSGMALLVIVFYWNAQTYMLNPAVTDISSSTAIGIGLLSLLSRSRSLACSARSRRARRSPTRIGRSSCVPARDPGMNVVSTPYGEPRGGSRRRPPCCDDVTIVTIISRLLP